MKKYKTGQSTIEYLIIFAIMVGVIILVAGRFRGHVRRAYGHLAGEMKAAVVP